MQSVKIGVIGCGNISGAYFTAAKTFAKYIQIVKVADINLSNAQKRAKEFGFEAVSVADLLADPELEIVVNLTTPQFHAAVNRQILQSGKHAYTEKPFALEPADGRAVLRLANHRHLQVGGAPDTFLGGAQQTCRQLIDGGAIGKVVSGTAFMLCHGHESWHPNPGFYYQNGGGPLFDMGPYYLTALVNLLGPVAQVAGAANRAFDKRICTAEVTRGKVLKVEVDTHVAGLLTFESGAVVTLVTSFDVWRHHNSCIELHGTDGSMEVPDPNCFGGEIKLYSPTQADWEEVKLSFGRTDNLRSIGVADLARSLHSAIPARCNGELANHVLEVMSALLKSAHTGKMQKIKSRCERPAPLPAALPDGDLGD